MTPPPSASTDDFLNEVGFSRFAGGRHWDTEFWNRAIEQQRYDHGQLVGAAALLVTIAALAIVAVSATILIL